MNCPLCNLELIKEYAGECTIYTCSKLIELPDRYETPSHYINNLSLNSYIMVVMPYRIVTHPDYSAIQKWYDICGFASITDSQILNIDPIFPQSEAKLLNRIETILVFS